MNVRPSALILHNNSVLTLRYCYGDTEVYALPGGNPDPGECLAEALARELQEEMGIISDVKEMIMSGEVIWKEIQRETLHVVFETNITGIPILNPAETTALEIVWIPVEELGKKILYPNVGRQIADYSQKLFRSGHIGIIDQPYIR